MWLHSQDDEFRTKRDEILRLYYETPADELVISVDEKPGIQALERRYAEVPMKPGQPVRREFEYVRHGTLTLMGALDVRSGKAFGFLAPTTGGEVFVELLEHVSRCYPRRSRGHIVCDNQSSHDTDDVLDWLEDHPQWTIHFTPKHASWLNQIECYFSVLQRRVLARGSFASTDELAERIHRYMVWHNDQAAPFRWSYRPKSWSAAPAGLRAA
jgi:transposase